MAAVNRPGSGEAAADFVQCYIKCTLNDVYVTIKLDEWPMQCWIKIKGERKRIYILLCVSVLCEFCVVRLFSEEIELIMYAFVCVCVRYLSNVTVIIYLKQYTTDLSSRLCRRDMLYSSRYSKVYKKDP